MAVIDVTSSNLTVSLKMLDVGPNFGKIPVLYAIVDNIDSAGAGDSVKLDSSAIAAIKTVSDLMPVVCSPGGSLTQYNESDFSTHLYPIQSSGTTDFPYCYLKVEVVASGTTRNYRFTMYGVSGNAVVSGNTQTGTLAPVVFLADTNKNVKAFTRLLLRNTDTSINAFSECANYGGSGLPVAVTGGHESMNTTLTVVLSILWPDANMPFSDPVVHVDPYDGAGDSGPGGGEGTFDYTGNPPGGWDPSLVPDISATDTGFVTLFNPTIAELQSLSNYLWSSAFDLNTFKKIFNDPMELFIGLSIVPVYVPDGGRKQVGIGLINTGVYMTLAGSQWVTVDCGTLNVPNFTGSYLDYDPYTRVEIYLPFIGVRTLKADEVSGKAVHVGYWVDLLSGACVAWIDINNVPMYQFMGQCATSIPMASGEWTSLINGIIGAVGAVASGAAVGGVGGAIAGGVAAASSVAVNDSKIQVERSGAITSAAGLVALQMPVLYISAPNLHKPANQNMFEGYPAYYTATLGDVSGYTTIESIRLQGIPATEPELEEIETLLKGGVIL